MNLLQNTRNIKRTSDQANFRNLQEKSTYYQSYSSVGPEPQHGQLGFISNLTINHNLENREAGVFEKLDASTNETVQNTILPKVIEVVVGFTPIHEHHLGWDKNQKFSPGEGEAFPYGVSTFDVRNMKSEFDGKTWNQAAQAEEDRAKVEQARLNAEARYGGMFGTKGLFGIGNGRLGRDMKRLEAGKYKGENADYVASAIMGQAINDVGYTDQDGTAAGDSALAGLADQLSDIGEND